VLPCRRSDRCEIQIEAMLTCIGSVPKYPRLRGIEVQGAVGSKRLGFTLPEPSGRLSAYRPALVRLWTGFRWLRICSKPYSAVLGLPSGCFPGNSPRRRERVLAGGACRSHPAAAVPAADPQREPTGDQLAPDGDYAVGGRSLFRSRLDHF
jgi:hypothetical protein